MNGTEITIIIAASIYLGFAFLIGWILTRPGPPPPPMAGQCPDCRERDGLHDTTCLSYRTRGRRP